MASYTISKLAKARPEDMAACLPMNGICMMQRCMGHE
jgi:hypothetical protein